MKEKLPVIPQTYPSNLSRWYVKGYDAAIGNQEASQLGERPVRISGEEAVSLRILCTSLQFVNCQRIKSLQRKVGNFPHRLTLHTICLLTSKKAVLLITSYWFDWRIYTQYKPLIVMAISTDLKRCWVLIGIPPDEQVSIFNHLKINAHLPLQEVPSNHLMTRSKLSKKPLKTMVIIKGKVGISSSHGNSLAWAVLLLCPLENY